MAEGFEGQSEPGDIEDIWTEIFKALSDDLSGASTNLLNMESFLKWFGGGAAYGDKGKQWGQGFLSSLGDLGESGIPSLDPYISGSAFPALQDLSAGIVPDSIKKTYRDQAREDRAAVTEAMGTAGARLGTDITTALANAGGQARNELAAYTEGQVIDSSNALANMALGAQGIETDAQLKANELIQSGVLGAQDILQKGQLGALGLNYGLGSDLMNIDFQRAESALQRELEKYGIDVQAESGLLAAILELILNQSEGERSYGA